MVSQMQLNVTKRNGSREEFNVEKIRQCIEFACENLEVAPLALESLFNENLYDGIPTSSIQENLIEHAKSLCSVTEPDWAFVAGRLETMQVWASTRAYDLDFLDFFNEQRKLGLWTHECFDAYSEEEIVAIGELIDRDRDLEHSYASVVTAKQKYLLPGECIQQMFMGNAMILAARIKQKSARFEKVKRIYDRLSERELSQATPWLGNLRNRGNISSCFIMEIEDSIESIYRALTKAAYISKSGGGLGVSFSRIRARGSWLMGYEGRSGGVLPWMRLFNDTAVAVNQAGKRAGAFTLALASWHNDIEEFLGSQREEGDHRTKIFDIQPQMVCTDLFMERVYEDVPETQINWHTFCPYEVKKVLGHDIASAWGDEFRRIYADCVSAKEQGRLKVTRAYNAKSLFKKEAMSAMYETGMPYMTFLDAVNEANPNKHDGFIPCFNLCTESTSNVVPDELDHTCNLLSVVVGRVGMAGLEEAAYDATWILDAGIDLTNPPTADSKNHNARYRTIGIGIQGLHDIIALEKSHYFDEDFVTEVAERIQFGAVRASIELAKELGPYPAFKGSEWDNGNMIKRFRKHSVVYGDRWLDLQAEIDKYGIRNSQLTSPAPNTSTSIFMDAAAGVMPVWSAFFYEDNQNGLMPVVAMHLKDNPLSYSRDVTRFNPWDLTKPISWLQRFMDTGISAEYLMDKNREDFKAVFLWDTVKSAWLNRTKAVYYIRTLKKGEKLVKGEEKCAGCAG